MLTVKILKAFAKLVEEADSPEPDQWQQMVDLINAFFEGIREEETDG